MSIASTAAPVSWPVYLSYQHEADSHVANSRSFGRDEQLSKILQLIESGEPVSSESIERLDRNRARKFRDQRKKLLEVYASDDQVFANGTSAHENAVMNDRVAWVRNNTSDLEFRCLWLAASGLQCDEIAVRVSRKPSTVRSLISRSRKRLRELSRVA